MRVLLAPDSYKGCLSSIGVCAAMRLGVLDAHPDAEIDIVPIADGGEGTVEAYQAACGGEMRMVRVRDPLFREIGARYLLLPGGVAVIEMAAASGLPLLSPGERDPLTATTYGTGELLSHAVKSGVRKIIIGIGGSATNDGGAGLAQALGAKLCDADGWPLPPGIGGGALTSVASIDLSALHATLEGVSIDVACDVTNPLCGPTGAAAIYGPQKGATPNMVRELDAALRHWSDLPRINRGADAAGLPGAGAAGGLGFGLLAMCGARLRRGFDLVAEAADLSSRMRGCDLVITGEGRTDSQTASGKAPAGVGALAAKAGVKAVCISGALGPGYEALYDCGVTACFSIADGPIALERCLSDAPELIRSAAKNILRLL